MGVGLVRSLQHPDILWIHWRVYNSIANTSKRVLFLPSSDVYVRSFLYLLYTLIKLYYTKALSDQSSLVSGPRLNSSPLEAKNPGIFLWFSNNLSASACNEGDSGSIHGLGRYPGEGNGNLLQYSCLENSMDGGAW